MSQTSSSGPGAVAGRRCAAIIRSGRRCSRPAAVGAEQCRQHQASPQSMKQLVARKKRMLEEQLANDQEVPVAEIRGVFRLERELENADRLERLRKLTAGP